MDPKVLMQLSQLIQQLPPEQLSRMQTLMHNAMAGFDVKKEMEEFEKGLPPGFREKLLSLMMGQTSTQGPTEAPTVASIQPISSTTTHSESASSDELSPEQMGIHEARITVLRAVADGTMSPEEAEKLLFTA